MKLRVAGDEIRLGLKGCLTGTAIHLIASHNAMHIITAHSLSAARIVGESAGNLHQRMAVSRLGSQFTVMPQHPPVAVRFFRGLSEPAWVASIGADPGWKT